MLKQIRYLLLVLCGLGMPAIALAQTSADELASMSSAQLAQEQEEAARRAQAMLNLLSGETMQNTVQTEEAAESQAVQLRPEVVREGEPSVGKKPAAGSNTSTHELTFAQIRSKLEGFTLLEEALRELQTFVQNYPRHREARLLLARTYSINVEHDRVLAVLRPLVTPLARDSDPDWQPWFWTGTAHLALGDLVQLVLFLQNSPTGNGNH